MSLCPQEASDDSLRFLFPLCRWNFSRTRTLGVSSFRWSKGRKACEMKRLWDETPVEQRRDERDRSALRRFPIIPSSHHHPIHFPSSISEIRPTDSERCQSGGSSPSPSPRGVFVTGDTGRREKWESDGTPPRPWAGERGGGGGGKGGGGRGSTSTSPVDTRMPTESE